MDAWIHKPIGKAMIPEELSPYELAELEHQCQQVHRAKAASVGVTWEPLFFVPPLEIGFRVDLSRYTKLGEING